MEKGRIEMVDMTDETIPPRPEFLACKVKCRHCNRIYTIRDLVCDEYILIIDGYFCPCDEEREYPLAGHNVMTGEEKFYPRFAELIERVPLPNEGNA